MVASARDSHRFITDGRQVEESPRYRPAPWSNPLDGDLPEPPGSPPVLQFGVGSLEPI